MCYRRIAKSGEKPKSALATLPRLGSRVRIPSPAPEFFNKIKEFWPAGADRNRLFFLRKSQSKRMVSMFGARFRCAFSITVYQLPDRTGCLAQSITCRHHRDVRKSEECLASIPAKHNLRRSTKDGRPPRDDSGMSSRGIAQGKANSRAAARWQLLSPGFDLCPLNSLSRAIVRLGPYPLDATIVPPIGRRHPTPFLRRPKALRKLSRPSEPGFCVIWANAPDGMPHLILSKKSSCAPQAASRRDGS